MELGLPRLFDKLTIKLDNQSVIDIDTCEKLLIRCQIMLSLRGELVRVLQQLATCESLIYAFTLPEKAPPTPNHSATKQKVEEIEAICEQTLTLIHKIVNERQQIIGNEFIYDGMDLIKPQNLKVKMTSLLLQGLNQIQVDYQLAQQVAQHKQMQRARLEE